MKDFRIMLLALVCMGIFSSCLKDECTSTAEVYAYEPVFMSLDDINNETISTEAAQSLKNPGKVFYIGSTMIISEIGEGVHLFDNSDKSNPVPLAFLRIPGNVDVSFKGTNFIADSYLSILAIDMSDISNPRIVSRIDDIKTDYYYYDEQKKAYLVDYIPSEEPVRIECNHPFFERSDNYYINRDFGIFSLDASFNVQNEIFADAAFVNSQGNTPGIAGSLSSFAIVGDYFYFISGPDVNVYNFKDMTNPYFTDGFEVAWNIETLFPYEDKLFIGGQNGMYIYDNSNPSSPSYLSEFVHARACDPVFVEGNTAYVTLSEGNRCTNFVTQLDVIDVTDLLNPTLIKSYDMYKPKGLSIYDNTLFLCAGYLLG